MTRLSGIRLEGAMYRMTLALSDERINELVTGLNAVFTYGRESARPGLRFDTRNRQSPVTATSRSAVGANRDLHNGSTRSQPSRRGEGQRMRRDQLLLLVSLGIDNFGSGLFLPLSILYTTQVIGLPLGEAGIALTVGSLVGFVVPPMAGRVVDRVGPRAVLITSQLVQAAGAFGFLFADGFGSVILVAALLAAGQQLFYCSVFALIADVAADGDKDHAFALANMVRAACFGLGTLTVGALLARGGTTAYTVAIAADGVSFLVAAALLAMVAVVHASSEDSPETAARTGVLRNRPYLALIMMTCLAVLAIDFFLVGFPVFVVDRLQGPVWLPGVALALVTALVSVGGTIALRATRGLSRIGALRLGAACYAAWCGMCLITPALPKAWWPAYLLATSAMLGAANLVFTPRATALSEAAAPRAQRGRYLAAFQYAFTVAHVVTPLVVGLFAIAEWLPWVVVGGGALISIAGFHKIGSRLPKAATMATPAIN